MQSADLFRTDIIQSERNHLKLSFSYVKLKEETARSKEVGFVTCVVNVPSRYLVEKKEDHVVREALKVLGTHTGFFLEGSNRNGVDKAKLASIVRKSYAIESTYILRSRSTGTERSWSGSWNPNNKLQRAGILDDFQPLISRNQLVESLRSWSDGAAIETKIKDVVKNKSTDWEYAGCVSVCLLIQLRGFFPPALRPRYTKITLSED